MVDIRATCEAIKGVQLEVDMGEGFGGIISPLDPNFDPDCRDLFLGTVEFQRSQNPRKEPQIWSPRFIQTVTSYLKRHNVKARLIGPLHPSGRGESLLSQGGGIIGLGLAARVAVSQDELLVGLNHELGHLRDHQLIGYFYPELLEGFLDEKVDRQKAIQMCEGYLHLLSRVLSSEEKEKFLELARMVFDDLEDLSAEDLSQLISILGELLRNGEEVYDQRRIRSALSPSFRHFKMDGPPQKFYEHVGITKKSGEQVDILRISLIALLKEAGIWEEFKTGQDIDLTLIQQFESKKDEGYIEFFRMAIRTASRYFPTIGEHKAILLTETKPESPKPDTLKEEPKAPKSPTIRDVFSCGCSLGAR